MARTKISEFSATPANNTDIDSINIAEGCSPSGINDAIRELMAQLKDFQTGAVGDSFNGPVGTTTAAAGAFTTLSASSTVSGTGFSTYLASPPAIGGTAAAAGSFTTLSASGNVTLSGGTANGVAYLNGSKVVTSGSALSFDGATLGVSNGSAGTAGISITGTYSGSGTVAFLNFQRAGGAVAGTLGYNDASTAIQFGTTTNHSTIFLQNNSEAMRLTSTGLGIGTSSPSNAKLVVSGTSAGTVGAIMSVDTASTTSFLRMVADLGSQNLINWQDGTALRFATSTQAYGTFNEWMRLNSSGNLGLGVTPSAWGSVWKAQQFQVGGFIASQTNANDIIHVGTNAFANSSNAWTYINTAASTRYEQYQGAHKWFNAASGTAGNAITFTQAMTLTSAGDLGIGTTSPASKLDLGGSSSGQSLSFSNTGTNGTTRIAASINYKTASYSGSPIIASYITGSFDDSQDIRFYTGGNTERARIDSSGNLLIGTTSNTNSSRCFVKSGGVGMGIQIGNTVSNQNAIDFYDGSGDVCGSITINPSANLTTYNTTSDYRLKNITGPITTSGAYIDSLNPVEGTWKSDGSTFVGLIAHEVQEASRTTVATGVKDGEEMQGMDYSSSEIIANLIAEVKSLRKRLADAGI